MNAGERPRRTPAETRRHLEESASRMEVRARVSAEIASLVNNLCVKYKISSHDMRAILTEIAEDQTSVR